MISAAQHRRRRHERALFPRAAYAVLWERTKEPGDADDLFDEPALPDVTGTTVDDMETFTVRAMANRRAKDIFYRWYSEHLSGSNDEGYLEQMNADLESGLTRVNEQEELFEREESLKKDTIRVWVKEIQPRGPGI